jgi:FtsZ-binding cell division protein ZapB
VSLNPTETQIEKAEDKIAEANAAIVEIQQAQIEAVKERERKRLADERQRTVEERKWLASKAGKICKKHPVWSRTDCKRVADGKYWLGMDVWMLVAQRGKPNSINKSNYGFGERHQYCWHDWTPMCFYDDNGDNKVDAYN